MIKIITVITARASYSRFKGVLLELNKNEQINSSIVCTCSAIIEKFGNISKVIESDGLSVTKTISTEVDGNNLEKMPLTVANTINQLTSIFKKENPDFIITIADRFETISTAIAASYMNIPLIHVQGGEITGNIDEKVRHAVSKLSDFHFVATEKAKNRLVNMGENPDSIFNTGCPSIDIINDINNVTELNLYKKLKESEEKNELDIGNGFIVVLLHSETESHNESFSRAEKLLHKLSELNKQLVIFWPNSDAGTEGISKAIRMFKNKRHDNNDIFIKNLESKFFLKLLSISNFLIGNSSVGIRECSFMGVPVINLGDRQRGRDRGRNLIDIKWEDLQSINLISAIQEKNSQKDNLYGDGNSSKKISQIITSLPKKYVKEFYE
ncbi:UDP-N-acetylglucosamine 2-epimerase [Gammaproteobacteria bacterium]|nr:UDP-N-acetylglucosamine 2-epimerase [Gammaproteobacteria bacterium]